MDSNTATVLAAVLGSTAFASVAAILANGAVKHLNGSAGRERTRNTSLKEQREEALRRERVAEKEADREAHNRRLTEEYASTLRRLLIEKCGVPEAMLPEWPELKKPPPDQEQQ